MNLTEKIGDSCSYRLVETELVEAIDLYDASLTKMVEVGKVQMEFSLYTWLLRYFVEENPNFNVYTLGEVRGKVLNQFYSDLDLEKRREVYKRRWGRYPKW